MPYIAVETRKELDSQVASLACSIVRREPNTRAGNANYAITSLIDQIYGFPDDDGVARCGYADLNEAVGVLECIKQEFYRRVAAPYEDRKKELNGDVYPYTMAATREKR